MLAQSKISGDKYEVERLRQGQRPWLAQTPGRTSSRTLDPWPLAQRAYALSREHRSQSCFLSLTGGDGVLYLCNAGGGKCLDPSLTFPSPCFVDFFILWLSAVCSFSILNPDFAFCRIKWALTLAVSLTHRDDRSGGTCSNISGDRWHLFSWISLVH